MRVSVSSRCLSWGMRALTVAVAISSLGLAAAANPQGLVSSDLLRLRSVGGVAASPDGKRVAYTVVMRLSLLPHLLQVALSSLTQGPTKRPCTTHLLSPGVSVMVIFSTSASHLRTLKSKTDARPWPASPAVQTR